MKLRNKVLVGMLSVLFAVPQFFVISIASAAQRLKPRLILQITVDQLRGDLPMRYYERLAEGGLRYLLDNGTVYSNAHHAPPITKPSSGTRRLRPAPTRPCTA